MGSLVFSADMVETEIRRKGNRIIAGELAVNDFVRIFTEIKDGQLRALEELYTKVASRLYGLALWRTGSSEDAADVVQGVFVYVAENRQRLSDVRSPENWLMTLTHRRAIDVIRGRQRHQQVPLAEIAFLEAPGGDHSRSIDAVHAFAHLGRLPAAQREVIYLRHFENCTFAEIGRVVGVPTFTAASRYRLGIKKLRRLMGVR
jgi:RNA polymerase sigma-70 factor (ECF subfamily)